MDSQYTRKLSYIEGWLSIFLNTVLFGLKLWAGLLTGSVAVVADAWHTLSDSLSSVVVLLGAKISTSPPDEEHPFGHGRVELIAALTIGLMLVMVGFNFFWDALMRLRGGETAEYHILAVIIFAVSVLVKEGLARFSFWAGKKTGSQPLKADGWHHRSDAIASAVILVGVFAGRSFWWMDGVLGIIVAFLILKTAWDILKEAIDPLLGEKPKQELLSTLQTLISGIIPENTGFDIHHLHLHSYGSHREVTFHLQFHSALSFSRAHNVCEAVRERLLEEMNIEATIHYEPWDAPGGD